MVLEGTSDGIIGDGLAVLSPAQAEELGSSNEKTHLGGPELVSTGEGDGGGKVYPPARKVAAVMLALYLSLFLVSLVSFPHSFPTSQQVLILFHRTAQSSPQPSPKSLMFSTPSTISAGTQAHT
jgi:hypothetical protein